MSLITDDDDDGFVWGFVIGMCVAALAIPVIVVWWDILLEFITTVWH